ncbi:hypothetical protein SAMN05444008_104281 [Cnuella takakiae]|uniref:Probable membrane transporter protein n=1 Tax=Cnuella takakiae TaxID=1302690 RepID=A0A1M4YHB1_9BACT|nr:sulfite exporter TauE/SafE family protein [Cnuella takakiae]OLY93149.1 hypothetical protein BUE76_15580 [Cnuella takakiae]SHF05109.1 hypothetical protein SAMN05444008_104281 [Cnuella takakiae]
MDHLVLFCCLLFGVAFLYASVGHGGASGYLALMALFSVSPAVMKPTALLLNLFVASVSFIQFYRAGHFRWKLFWPLALASIPMAFVGGLVSIDAAIYKKILGLLLLIPVLRFFIFRNMPDTPRRKEHLGLSLAIGAGIGLLSGLIGIGGGIILSPVVLLLGWANQKQTAAISALFIFVNSLSGLAGQLVKGISISQDMVLFVALAFAGGLLGAYFGAKKFKQPVLQQILASVLLLAVYKLLFTQA